jgi:DNA-directed RNA polymerase subunit alpha
MPAINFKTTALVETKDFGRFELSPLEAGYGLTIGNALRRVLLSSLPGAAITSVTIDGVTHQFTTIAGMKEDVVELLLNLKQVRFKYSGAEPVEAKLQVTGGGKVKAGDIEVPAKVSVINKDLLLANLSPKTKLSAKLEISSGYGYLAAQGRTPKHLGEILLDAAFSPVVRVNFHIESARVGRQADLDKLVLEIYTNGVIKPADALNEAAKILIRSFDQIVNPVAAPEPQTAPVVAGGDNELMKLSVEELDLPTRIANALKKGGYATVGDLGSAPKADLAKVKNLGGKSLDIILKKLKAKGVEVK